MEVKETTMDINLLTKKMNQHANHVDLPKRYKEDLEIDFLILKRYGNIPYVWLLRECGSILFPLKKGELTGR